MGIASTAGDFSPESHPNETRAIRPAMKSRVSLSIFLAK
jgi:hypothetical protein